MPSGRYSSSLSKHVRRLLGHRLYSSKVRVFPFVVSKEQAVQDLSMDTAIFTGNKTVRTYLLRRFPSLNIDGLRPTRFQPAYVPTWFVDAQIHAEVRLKDTPAHRKSRKSNTEVQFAHSCMPGLVHYPVSAASLTTTDLLRTQPAQWSEDMRRHNGDDVVCLPFTLSPFRVVEAVRSLSLADTNLNIVRIIPSSVREISMAAYPVLLPVYLAQYTVRTRINGRRQQYTISAFMEGARAQPRKYIEMVPFTANLAARFGLGPPISKQPGSSRPPGMIIRGAPLERPPRFTNVRSILGPRTTSDHRRYIEHWINLALEHGDPLEQYHNQYFAEGKGSVDWEDIRIRPFTFEERSANMRWLESAEDLFVLQQLPKVRGQKRVVPGKDGKFAESTQEQIQSTHEKIESLMKERERIKPEGLAQYENQQRLLAMTHTSEVGQ